MTISAPRRVAASAAVGVAQTCPLCLSPMELRPTSPGQQTGTWFWGCTRFPQCRGMISAPQPAPALVDAAPVSAPPVRAFSGARRARSRTGLFTLTVVLIVITLLAIILFGALPTLAPRPLP